MPLARSRRILETVMGSAGHFMKMKDGILGVVPVEIHRAQKFPSPDMMEPSVRFDIPLDWWS